MILRNWTASSIFFARTALPTNLLTFTDGGKFVRPDVVPGQPFYVYDSQYAGGRTINGAAFATPPANVQEGNLGRNVLRGFGAWQADLALHRQFGLSEHTSLQLRAEAFNVFNHPSFGNPSFPQPQCDLLVGKLPVSPSYNSLATGLSSVGTLGQLNPLFQIGGSRSMQLALRLIF